MGDVRVSHQKIFFADLRESAPKRRPAVNGYKFANGGPSADFDIAFFALEFNRLGNSADRGVLKYLTIRADGDPTTVLGPIVTFSRIIV
jgi:hypothetical protein